MPQKRFRLTKYSNEVLSSMGDNDSGGKGGDELRLAYLADRIGSAFPKLAGAKIEKA